MDILTLNIGEIKLIKTIKKTIGETPKMIEKEIMHKFKLFYYIYIKSYGIIKPKRILI